MNDFKRKRTPEQNLKKVEGYIPPQQFNSVNIMTSIANYFRFITYRQFCIG